ncbi:hypothetical protein EVAR_43183_1 [Eumeta japonica]|uniref:Mos1 transposase HTH domain-containing protein n=1 Tax=Eumeta variegata TaxID=151549 RepID=A0A4C1XKH2_EUMVA|nr:hypothetical protein EVAR_43183_1 [Eumeta japonica]
MVPPSFELWSAMSANGLEADGDDGAEGGAVGGIMGEGAGGEETAAKRMWRSACGALLAPSTERSWDAVVRHSPGDAVWHSLNNCVNYQRTMNLSTCSVQKLNKETLLLRLAFHHEAPSLATVHNWFNEFKRDHTNLTDDLREGGSSTATTKDIRAVRLVMETDKRVTYQQICTSLGIGMCQEDKILGEHLAASKLCTQWITDNLTEAQKLRRANWCREMMQIFAGDDSNAIYIIVTVDES